MSAPITYFKLTSFLSLVLLVGCSHWTTTRNPAEQPAQTAIPPSAAANSGPVVYPGPDAAAIPADASDQGIIGVYVPAIVTEPPAYYDVPDSAARYADLYPTEVPAPRRRQPRPTGQVTADPGVQDSSGPAINTAPNLALESSFQSLDFDDNAANAGGFLFIPADASGAAGPNHVVSVVNVSLQFHTKDGTPLLDSTAGAPVTGISLQNFFSPLTPANATFDPKVIYDQYENRFLVITLERQDTLAGDAADESRILIAVSDDSDPNGVWYMLGFDSEVNISGNDTWADYPGFAVDEEAVYITANMFEYFSTGGFFAGTRLWIIGKNVGAGGGFYGGGTASVNLFDPYAGGGNPGTSQPAHLFGTAPSNPNVGTWLSFFNGLTNGTNEFLQILRVDDPIGPGTTTFVGPAFIDLGDIDDDPLSGLPDAPQKDTAETIETNDRRTLHSVWRNDKLYVTTTVDPPVGDPNDGQTSAHWVQMNADGTGPTFSDQGGIDGEDIADDVFTFFPSIAVNDSEDVAISYSYSGATVFPGSAVTTRRSADAAGTNTGSQVIQAGQDYYIRTFDSAPCNAPPSDNRWGDYSGIAVDPFDQCFWSFNKYAQSRGTGTTGGCNGRPATEDGRWGTAFGNFCESCKTNIVLDSLAVSGTETHEARDSITALSGGVDATGDLTLTSSLVVLESGFQVTLGGELTVINGPCM